jgi:CPA2 family monovalent cation:H+ antiporter-2
MAQANTVILSASGSAGTAEVIRLARELNPSVHVLARATYLSETRKFKKAGADVVFWGEGDIGLAFTVSRRARTDARVDAERACANGERGRW